VVEGVEGVEEVEVVEGVEGVEVVVDSKGPCHPECVIGGP
jgi:hypothetical protein